MMKLCFESNNLRLELYPADVEQLQNLGVVSDALVFCEGIELEYRVQTEAVPFISATYSAGKIVVRLPQQTAQEWLRSDRLTLKRDQPLYNGFHLNVYIEKNAIVPPAPTFSSCP